LKPHHSFVNTLYSSPPRNYIRTRRSYCR